MNALYIYVYIYNLSSFRRLLIVSLLSLTIIATVFDYTVYAEKITWQWNQGTYMNWHCVN